MRIPSLGFYPVQERDEAALTEFFAQLIANGDDRWFHPHPFTSEYARRIATYDGEDLYCVGTDGRRILAYGMLRGWEEGYDVARLGIAVAREARGTGLARAFMHYLHLSARMRGSVTLGLTVYAANSAACRLYESLGYRLKPGKPGQLVGHCQLEKCA